VSARRLFMGTLSHLRCFTKVLQDTPTRCCLHSDEPRLNLPAELRRRVSNDWAATAAVSIYETNNPSVVPESFLLVFRTSHIVTGWHAVTVPTGCVTTSEPSSGGSTGFSSIWPTAHRAVTDAGGNTPCLLGVSLTLGPL
jgi:hypothetical protein